MCSVETLGALSPALEAVSRRPVGLISICQDKEEEFLDCCIPRTFPISQSSFGGGLCAVQVGPSSSASPVNELLWGVEAGVAKTRPSSQALLFCGRLPCGRLCL